MIQKVFYTKKVLCIYNKIQFFLTKIFMYNTRGKTPGKSQGQAQKKQQIVDQNFANNTLFMTLSDIETIEQKYLQQRSPKQFGMYDPCDYSHREIDVLKEQLRLKLILVKSSLYGFSQDYGTGSYKLPRDFDKYRVIQRLRQFKRTFENYDRDCQYMCEDLINMLDGRNYSLKFETMKFKNSQSVSYQENVRGMVEASTKMRGTKKQFQQMYDEKMEAEDIKFKDNPAHRSSIKQNQVNRSPTKQNSLHRSSIREKNTNKLLRLSNGQQYEGDLANSVPHGKGTLHTPEGKYIGQFFNGYLHGQAEFFDKNGRRTYVKFYLGEKIY